MDGKNRGYIYGDRVGAADEGRCVLEFYTRYYSHSTAEEWRSRIISGEVKRNGDLTRPSTRLRERDKLEWRRPPWKEPRAPRGFAVLVEEASFLVVDKPPGLPVLPGAGFMENTLLHRVRERFGAPGSPIHRLGRWTSGAVLFARNPEAARKLGGFMQDRRFSKTYLALAGSADLPDVFNISVPIGPVAYAPLGTVHAAAADGRPAESRVRVLRRIPARRVSLVEVVITTGRPHQIRIHMAAAGFPLAGDPLYGPGGLPRGEGALPGDPGYCLHAWKLGFPHPVTNEDVAVESPPPHWARGESKRG